MSNEKYCELFDSPLPMVDGSVDAHTVETFVGPTTAS
jgi:hypothetical protein